MGTRLLENKVDRRILGMKLGKEQGLGGNGNPAYLGTGETRNGAA